MIPYTGNNSMKQKIQTKSIRFRYKNSLLCSAAGYPYFIDPYFGDEYGWEKVSKKLCVRSVADCVTEVYNWEDKEDLFDNWYSSLSLITVLKYKGILATETVTTDCFG